MRLSHTIATTSLLFAAAISPAHAALLGPASDYNVFVFGNFISSNSDTEGNLAAGGNITLANYSVASQISGNAARLVVNGTLTASNGGVGNGQNGSIYAGGTLLSSFTANGGVFAQTLVDFSGAQTQYQNISNAWNALTANGSVGNNYGTLNLTGNSSELNVFDIDGAELTASNTINISAPSNSTVLINVGGTGQIFQNGQVNLNGIDATHVIYNFYDATSLTLAGSKNPQGSILAPWANVFGGYGQLNGQLVAQSFNGNIEFHNQLFASNIAAVPVPAAIWLFGSALGILGINGRKKLAR